MQVCKLFFFIVFICSTNYSFAQKKGKLPKDTLPKLNTASFMQINNWIDSSAAEQKVGIPIKRPKNNNGFMLGISILVLFSIVNLLFSKYIRELWIISFKSSFRVSSLKAQLSSNTAASLMLNIFFCLAAGIFINLLLQWKYINFVSNQWWQLALCIAAVAGAYLVKYLVLNAIGYLFQQRKVVNDYIFIVFLCNKLIGIVLLPVICLLLVNTTWMQPILLVTVFFIAVFILYRYLVSYLTIAKSVRMSQFHFFVYLCGVEIMPLLLLYKFFIK